MAMYRPGGTALCSIGVPEIKKEHRGLGETTAEQPD